MMQRESHADQRDSGLLPVFTSTKRSWTLPNTVSPDLFRKLDPPSASQRFLNAPLPNNCTTLPVVCLGEVFWLTTFLFFVFSSFDWTPETFSDYVSGKVYTIRDELGTAKASPPVAEQHFSGQPLSIFQPVSEKTVRNVIVKAARKTCELDPVPPFCVIVLILFFYHPCHKRISCFWNLSKLSQKSHCSPPPQKSTTDQNCLKNYRLDLFFVFLVKDHWKKFVPLTVAWSPQHY